MDAYGVGMVVRARMIGTTNAPPTYAGRCCVNFAGIQTGLVADTGDV